MHVEEEAQARREVVNVQAALERPAHIFEAVGQRERQFLHGGAASLADVVAADADRVPLRHVLRAELDGIGHEAHRRLWREDEFFLRDVFFEDVVLQRAAQRRHRDALLFSGGDVKRPDDRRGAVDGHAGGDFVQRDAVEQDFHVFERTDRHAAFAELAKRFGRVGVVAHQRGQIEGDG